MTEIDVLYDNLRLLLSAGDSLPLPKHELTEKLLRNLYSEEEASIISASFDDIREEQNTDQISEKYCIKDKNILKQMLDQMVYKGTLFSKKESTYYMMPYLPGVFEAYFMALRDIHERLKEVGKAHRGLRKINFGCEDDWINSIPTDFNKDSEWRFVPAMEPVLRTIEINENIDVKTEILPYEVLEKQLSVFNIFSETPCSCREAARLAGEPCERTTENFCIQAGEYAERIIKNGIGKQLSYDEAMIRLKEAEKHGLVHSTVNKLEPTRFVCNCCPCCCMPLAPVIKGYRLDVAKTNFNPIVDHDLCILCEICVNICPVATIEHIDDSDEEKIVIGLNSCLGCGLCASNCPEGAISLEKVRNDMPPL